MARKKNIIAIMSPKGGVGKTVTTANLAAALALIFDKKILAVDTNVSTASLGVHLNIFYPEHTISDGFEKNPIKKAIHIYHQNLHVIPASIKIKEKERDIKSLRENLYSTIKNYENFIENLSEKYDLILLDCSPGFDLETLAAMHIAGGLIIVTNPDYPSIITAIKSVEYAKRIGIPLGGFVLNNVKKKNYEIKKENIEDILKIKILGEIPYDKRIPESIAKRKPIVLLKSNSKSSRAFKNLAASLIGETPKENWFKQFFRIKQKRLKRKKTIK